jgi:hypothetical protein
MNLNQLIHSATLAPSGHNTQPWKFSVDSNVIRLFPDFSRRLPVVDPDDHALNISLGFPFVPRWLGRFILKTFAKPESEASKTEKQIRSSSLLLLFISKKNDKKHWVETGRSFQRIALTATTLGLAHAHLNLPCEVESVRKKLSTQLGLDHEEQPLLLIRFGYAKERPRSPRRPAEEVTENLNEHNSRWE